MVTAVGLVSVFMISGCAVDERPSSMSTTTAPSTTVSAATGEADYRCVEVPIADHWSAEDKVLHSMIAELPMPTGTCLSFVHSSEVGRSGMLAVYVHMDVPGSAGANDLRAVATDIADLVKGTEIGKRIATLAVTNRGVTTASKYPDYLLDENFQDHAWDGSQSRAVEMGYWSVAIWPA